MLSFQVAGRQFDIDKTGKAWAKVETDYCVARIDGAKRMSQAIKEHGGDGPSYQEKGILTNKIDPFKDLISREHLEGVARFLLQRGRKIGGAETLAWWGLGNVEENKGDVFLFLPKQRNSVAHVKGEDEELSAWAAASKVTLRGTVHTHPGSSNHASGTDVDSWLEDFPGIHFIAAKDGNKIKLAAYYSVLNAGECWRVGEIEFDCDGAIYQLKDFGIAPSLRKAKKLPFNALEPETRQIGYRPPQDQNGSSQAGIAHYYRRNLWDDEDTDTEPVYGNYRFRQDQNPIPEITDSSTAASPTVMMITMVSDSLVKGIIQGHVYGFFFRDQSWYYIGKAADVAYKTGGIWKQCQRPARYITVQESQVNFEDQRTGARDTIRIPEDTTRRIVVADGKSAKLTKHERRMLKASKKAESRLASHYTRVDALRSAAQRGDKFAVGYLAGLQASEEVAGLLDILEGEVL